MNKKIILSGGIFLAVLMIAGMVFAQPFGQNNEKRNFQFNSEEMQEVHEQIEAAISSGDYEAWVAIHEENKLNGRGNMLEVINEDNFPLLAELQDHREAVKQIKEELGIENQRGPGFRQGAKEGFRQGMKRGQQNGFVQGMRKGLQNGTNCQIQ